MAQGESQREARGSFRLVVVGLIAALAAAVILTILVSLTASALFGSVPFLTGTPPSGQVASVLDPPAEVAVSGAEGDESTALAEIGTDGVTVYNGCANDVFRQFSPATP